MLADRYTVCLAWATEETPGFACINQCLFDLAIGDRSRLQFFHGTFFLEHVRLHQHDHTSELFYDHLHLSGVMGVSSIYHINNSVMAGFPSPVQRFADGESRRDSSLGSQHILRLENHRHTGTEELRYH